MTSNDVTTRRKISRAPMIAGLSLAITLFAASTAAIAQNSDSKPADAKPAGGYETFFLANITQQAELNDIQTDMRNMLSRAKIYGMPSQHAISVLGSPEDLAMARKMISEFDRPKKVYRLTYTINEMDAGKRVGSQSVSCIAISGERTDVKQGSRVPILTGTTDADSSRSKTQVQYIDMGTNIEATVDAFQDGVRLRTKVERSSVADERSGVGAQDPVIRQATLQATTNMTPGKPLALGSMDIPKSTKSLDVEVVAELVK